jgi:DNA-binding MarR family transcriptional regulator
MDMPGEDQVTLAARVAFDAATSGSVIGRLEARGWIRRELDPRTSAASCCGSLPKGSGRWRA